MLRLQEILEPMGAGVDQRPVLANPGVDSLHGCRGEQNLAAVAGGEHPRDPVDGRSEEVVTGWMQLGGVYRCPYLQRAELTPVFRVKSALDRDRGSDRVGSIRERRAERVTDRLENS